MSITPQLVGCVFGTVEEGVAAVRLVSSDSTPSGLHNIRTDPP